MLNETSILRQVENPHQRDDDLISDFCDGYVYSQHPLFSKDPQALQIMLYYDEVEVVNPLGSKTSKHKVGVFYYTLGNIDPVHRSQLKCIQILSIAKRSIVQKYGTNTILEPFMKDILLLEQDAGYQFNIKGEMRSFAGTIAFVSGDNLASQELGGFKIGSGAALKCRECMGNNDDITTKFCEDDFFLRTTTGYDHNCSQIENSPVDITSIYGINHRSILNQSRYFHVIGGLPGDAMHDVLEGLLAYETKEFLKYAIREQRFFSLDQLNQALQAFDYGYIDTSNKPSPIALKTLNSSTNSLKQRASQMWCLGKYLPQIIGGHVPADNEKWHLYIMLLEIVDIIFSPVTTINKVSYLKDLIQEHHTTFVQLYPDCSIIPKMHYMVHYPRTMLRLGPMVRTWCMRFEAKHERLKRLATSLGNFINIPWTLASRHQHKQCYEMACKREGQPCIEKPMEVGPGTQKEAQSATYYDLLQVKMENLSEDDMIHETKWCIIHGTKYKVGAVVHIGYDDLMPKFGIIKTIFVASCLNMMNIRNLFFVVKEILTIAYDSHVHAYKVQQTLYLDEHVFRQSDLVTFKPMHISSPIGIQGVKYVCPKLDVDVYNEQI